MSDGSNVMAEAEYHDDTYTYHLINPLIIMNNSVQGVGEVTTATPFLPGNASDRVIIPSSFIVTMSEVDSFYTRFYGTSLLKFLIQSTMRQMYSDGVTELDKAHSDALELKKDEIESKYGIIADDAKQVMTTERVLH